MGKVLICGTRKLTRAQAARADMHLWLIFDELPKRSQIVTGGADGIDAIALDSAQELGFRTHKVIPDYNRYPPRIAPLRRNAKMAKMKLDQVHAIWDGKSTGTLNMISEAVKAGHKVTVWPI